MCSVGAIYIVYFTYNVLVEIAEKDSFEYFRNHKKSRVANSVVSLYITVAVSMRYYQGSLFPLGFKLSRITGMLRMDGISLEDSCWLHLHGCPPGSVQDIQGEKYKIARWGLKGAIARDAHGTDVNNS